LRGRLLPSMASAPAGGIDGRGVSGQYGEMDETCPISTRGEGALVFVDAAGGCLGGTGGGVSG